MLAHRGVHQNFDPQGVDDATCTAERIYPIEHEYIENTIPSMQAAFDLGADVIEIDIASTTDGVLAVFHDWTVDCRTEGSGEVRSFTWDELSGLDVGYGYTSDGVNYPLRGKGQGMLPRLEQVLEAFPDGAFLVNFKSDDVTEAQLLHDVIVRSDAADQVWAVYGGAANVEAYLSLAAARGFTEEGVLACLARYMTAPQAADAECSNTVVAVSLDIAELLPGWPQAFVDQMAEWGTDVLIVGPGVSGIDTVESFSALPQDLDAYVWTDRIEVVGPLAPSG